MKGIETGTVKNSTLLFLGMGIIAITIFFRIIFYTGFLGSDEVTYTEAAFSVLHGNWTVSSYAGSNRYGINLPVAVLMSIFGTSEYSANLWSFLCSVLEVTVVLVLGTRLLGYKIAFIGALLLALLPIHVHFAGRLMADSPLALFITLSFLLFWLGEKHDHLISFLFAGISAGFVFWVKPIVAILYILVFLTYPLIFRRWNFRWIWMVAGFATFVGANMIFFWWAAGDPLFVFRVMFNQSSLDKIVGNEDAYFYPSYYLVYLFGKIWHTWLLGPLSLFALVLWIWKRFTSHHLTNENIPFLIWWSLGLMCIFSLFIISWEPLTFIMKQTNYMLIFVAPLSLLAGYGLTILSNKFLTLMLTIFILPSIVLAGMEQRLIHVHTANSLTTYAFAQTHNDTNVFVGTNAKMFALFKRVTGHAAQKNIRSLDELKNGKNDVLELGNYLIFDTQTFTKEERTIVKELLDKKSPCLSEEVSTKIKDKPAILNFFSVGINSTFDLLASKTESLLQPSPAIIYKVSSLDACSNYQ